MADYLALKTELAGNEYEGMTDAQAAAHFNAKAVAVRSPLIPISAVMQWAGSGPMDSIEAGQSFAHADPATQRAVRAACKTAIRLFNGAAVTFDVDSVVNRQLLGMFVAVGIVSSDEANALIALGETSIAIQSQPGQFGLAASGAMSPAHERSNVEDSSWLISRSPTAVRPP